MNELNNRSAVRFKTADWITAPIITALSCVLAYIFVDVLFSFELGYSLFVFAGVYLALFVTAIFYVIIKHKPIGAGSVLTAVLCAVLGLSFVLHGDITVLFFVFVSLFYLSGSLCVSATKSAAFSSGSVYYPFDVLRCLSVFPLVNLPALFRAAFSQKGKSKRLGGAILGVICAVPVLSAVVVLLIKGDAAFESVASDIVEKLFSGKTFSVIICTVIFTLYILSAMFSFRYSLMGIDKQKANRIVGGIRFIPVSIVGGFLGSVGTVYVVYLLSQLVYFFGAFTGKMPASVKMTVAEYSRRGFFEMSAVAAINLLLIFAAVVFTKRTENRISKPVKWFSFFLCVFTEILIVTAMSKMALYISLFGLTRKRIFVTAIIFVMFVTFITVIIRLFKANFPYMRIISALLFTVIVLFGIVNVNGVIARCNANAYLSGKIKTVDVEMLGELGTASLDSLYKLAKQADSKTARKAEEEIGGFFTYEKGSYSGCFYINDIDIISLSDKPCCLQEIFALKKVQKMQDEYLEIVERNNPRPASVYVYLSTDVKIDWLSLDDDETYPDGNGIFEKYKIYEFKVSPNLSYYSFSAERYDEYEMFFIDCEKGGLIEIYDGKDGKLCAKTVGEFGTTLEQAENICQKAKKNAGA